MKHDPSSLFAEFKRHVMMFEASAEGVMHFLSEPLSNALGVETSQLVGKNWFDLAQPSSATTPHQMMTAPFRIPSDAQSFQFECTMVRKNGEKLPVEINAISLDPKQTKFMMICRDISERKQKEARLIERIERLRQAVDAKDAEIANIRHVTAFELTKEILHEASQPLTAIRCYGGIAQSILKDTRLIETDQIEPLLQTMIRSSELTTDILRRFCDATDGRSIVLKSEDIRELVDDVMQLLAFSIENRGITLRTEIDHGAVSLDRIQIQQVFLNLVRNSIEATQVDEGEIVVSAKRQPHCWQFSVRDNGPGVQNDQLRRLFLPMKSRKKDGAGVGLSVSQSIIRCHGGVIRYSPVHPTGARFQFELPAKSMPMIKHRMAGSPSTP